MGFRCRDEGKRTELCAPAREWKRIDLAQATQLELQKNYSYVDEARQSVMQNHPDNTVTPTMSAPVSTPEPAPAPAPVK